MIWLWIIIAFLAGAVVAYWLCTRSQEDAAAAVEPAPRPEPAPAPQPEVQAIAEAPVDPDDLTKIEGVGPKIAELLNDGGIATFAALGGTAVERLQEILDAAGARYQVHNPASWPMQAQLAAEGQWDELEELQDRLDGGKLQ